MRRSLILLAAVLSAATVAACGSSTSSSPAASGSTPAPMAAALSYFPTGTPFIVTFQTDPDSAALKAAETHQTTTQIAAKAAFFQALAKLGINYNQDVKPLLGNPVAVGIASSDVTSKNTPLLGAWQTSNRTALTRLVGKIKQLSVSGHHDGATLYSSPGAGGFALAVDGPTVLVSDSADTIDSALDRHQATSGFSAAEYAEYTRGLPSNSLASVVGDLHSALAQPSAAKALKVPWVAAIKGYGATVDGTSSQVSMHLRLDTTGKPLTESQLPFASGPSAPSLAGTMPIQFAVRDPGAIWSFILGSVQRVQPNSIAKVTKGEAKLKRVTGVDFDQLVHSLTGDLQIESNGQAVLGRVPVSDPASVEKLLSTHATNGMLKGDRVTSIGGGLYRVQGRSDAGHPTLTGMVGHEFVIGEKTTAGALRRWATAPTSAASDSGAVAFKLKLAPFITMALAREPNPVVQQFARRIGDLTGSLQASTSGLTGEATVDVTPGS